MSSDKAIPKKQQEDNEMVIMGIVAVIAAIVLPIIVLALPIALLLSAFLEEENGQYKFAYGIFFAVSFYIFLFGFSSDFYPGFCFSALDTTFRELFNELMAIKPKFLKFYPQYPKDVRTYFYFSLPASIAMGIAFRFMGNKKKKKERQDYFAPPKSGVFSGFLMGIRLLSLPYELAFMFGLRAGGRFFSTKARVLIFSFLSLTFGYIVVYLFLGPVNSWHIHFGYFVNLMSPGLFDYLSPVWVNGIKSVIYFAGALYPTYLLINFKNLKIETRQIEEAKHNATGDVFLGTDHNGKKFSLTNRVLNHHVHVVGATGFGKTVFITNVIKSKIGAGEGIILTDLKGDIDLIREIISYTIEAGRSDDFEFFSISEDLLGVSSNLSVFENGNSLEIKDKVMGAFNPDHAYYKKRMESFLTIALRGLVWRRDNKGIPFDFSDIYQMIGQFDKIEELALEIDDLEIKGDIERLIVDKKLKEDLTGLRADIESLIKTDFGPLLSGGGGINFYESMTRGKIVFIHLDSQRYEATAERLGRLILQDIKTASAKVVTTIPKEKRRPITLIVDEFANLATEQFVGFLNKARGSRIGIVIAHQELSDLEAFSPTVRDQVMTNTSTLVSFLQKLPESAETIAGIAGTITTEKDTTQYEESGLFFKTQKETGMGSKREVEEYIIHPNLIKNLSVGECFVVSKYPPPVIAKLFVNQAAPARMISIGEMKEFLASVRKGAVKPIEQNVVEDIEEGEGDWLQ